MPESSEWTAERSMPNLPSAGSAAGVGNEFLLRSARPSRSGIDRFTQRRHWLFANRPQQIQSGITSVADWRRRNRRRWLSGKRRRSIAGEDRANSREISRQSVLLVGTADDAAQAPCLPLVAGIGGSADGSFWPAAGAGGADFSSTSEAHSMNERLLPPLACPSHRRRGDRSLRQANRDRRRNPKRLPPLRPHRLRRVRPAPRNGDRRRVDRNRSVCRPHKFSTCPCHSR